MGFHIFNASAGSGKTFAITVRYLSIVLNPKLHTLVFREILAITFTNKAVNELKNRIIKSLKEFSYMSDEIEKSSMFLEVQRILDLPKELIEKRAQLILKKILHNYNLFDISTIDRFNHKIIRTFSVEMALVSNFNIRLEEEEYLSRATSDVLDQIDIKHPLSPLLIEYAKEKIQENKSWDFSSEIMSVAKLLLDETHYNRFKTLSAFELEDFIQLRKVCLFKKNMAQKEIAIKAEKFFNLINEKGLSETDFYKKLCYIFFRKAKDKALKYEQTETNWIANISEKPLYTKKLEKDFPDKARILDDIKPEIIDCVRAVKQQLSHALFINNIIINLIPTAIINSINQALDCLKEKESVIFISEFNKHISEIIKDYDTPFIYERLGTRYRYYFIDEFQDTSKLQWANLIPLVSNALETLYKDGTSGELYIVGDVKQSIYRWRGGRPEQFINLYNKNHQPFQVEAISQSLDYNYRSDKAIVEFNNNFFSSESVLKYLTLGNYKKLYEKCIQKCISKHTGYVEINFLNVIDKKELELAYCKELERLILKLKQNGYLEKDICIIVRKNDEANILANYLQNLETPIPVSTVDSLFLNDNPNIQFIEDLLTWTHHPNKNILYWSISYYLTLKKEGEITHERIENFLTNFEKHLLEEYNFRRSHIYELNLYESILYVVDCFNLQWDNYLQTYFDVVLSFMNNSTKGHSIFEFLNYWESAKNKQKISTLENLNAVRIMTIHKSKGLEFPIAIYPFADMDVYEDKNAKLWYDLDNSFESEIPFAILNKKKDIAGYNDVTKALYEQNIQKVALDNINLLYVMLTRAKNQSYIITKHGNQKKTSTSNILSEFLKSQGLWQNQTYKYTFGEDVPAKNQNVEPLNEETFLKIQPKKKLDRSPLKIRKGQHHSKAAEIGLIVHKALSKIKKASEAPKIISELSIQHSLDESTLKVITHKIKAVVNHVQLKEYFSDKIKIFNEKKVLGLNQEIIRPDKIAINGNDASIIDFKTGKPLQKHKQQILKYAEVLEHLEYNIKNKILVYVDLQIKLMFI